MNHPFKIATVSALCAFPSIASACSCAPPPAPKIALQEAAAVFVGRVTSVKRGNANTFQFAISKQWKGTDGKSVSIATATSSAACGINFDSDRDYLVYAFKLDGETQLRTNLCTRTTRAADAAADLTELGAPIKAVSTDVDMPLKRDQNNGEIQINAKPGDDPMVSLARALDGNGSAQRFRVNWTAPTSAPFFGTALYNRANSTLKTYSRSEDDSQIKISSVLYSSVTDNVLKKLAATENVENFFRTYTNYGVSKKDLGSKTVSISG